MLVLSEFYQQNFSAKTYKLSLDAGCTCPNRDGTKAFGGCIFCSENGSGDFAANRNLPVKEQVEAAKKLVESKLRGRSGNRKGKYIAYFQNFTSTYGDTKTLVQKYNEALECEDVMGLAIATRPDCLGDEILFQIAKIAEKHFVQIEIGLQTSNEKTGKLINRCYTNEDYKDSLRRIKLASEKIHIVTHLIFGLPGETEGDMLDSVRFVLRENTKDSSQSEGKHREIACLEETYLNKINSVPSVRNLKSLFGIKITTLYIVQNTRLAQMYESGEVMPLSKEDYFALLKKAIALLPENCVIHRLTGDPPKKTLLAPLWTTDKKRVMNQLKLLISN